MNFTIENNLIKRTIYFENSLPVKSEILNKTTGFLWESTEGESLINIPGISLSGSEITLSESSVTFKTNSAEVVWEFNLAGGFCESRIGIKSAPYTVEKKDYKASDGANIAGSIANEEYTDGFGVMSNIVDIDAIELMSRTDNTNFLLGETHAPLFNNHGNTCHRGNIFILTEKFSKEKLVVVKNSLTGRRDEYNIKPEPPQIMHTLGLGIDFSRLSKDFYTYSYSVAIGVVLSDVCREIKEYYNDEYTQKTSYIISNTWGDRSQDKCVCEEFIKKEIDKAHFLGVDIVQIDDGWQQGATANSALVKSNVWNLGFRENKEFWNIHKDKFPNGFSGITEYAASKGIKLGLWFSPDAKNSYEAWQEDAKTLCELYDNYNIEHFKIDGVIINDKESEENLLAFLAYVDNHAKGRVTFNLDITAGERLGYLFNRRFGELFVENRYTDWGNYYPHATLRNLWQLSKYIPSTKMQFEVLNPERNRNNYKDDLAPGTYDIDYIFASVMVSNPLIWMEMSSLSEDNLNKLQEIISVYRRYREDFLYVEPILECPDGFSLTGFKIYGKESNYVVLLKELTERSDFGITVKEILATNDENASEQGKLFKKKSYMFAKI